MQYAIVWIFSRAALYLDKYLYCANCWNNSDNSSEARLHQYTPGYTRIQPKISISKLLQPHDTPQLAHLCPALTVFKLFLCLYPLSSTSNLRPCLLQPLPCRPCEPSWGTAPWSFFVLCFYTIISLFSHFYGGHRPSIDRWPVIIYFCHRVARAIFPLAGLEIIWIIIWKCWWSSRSEERRNGPNLFKLPITESWRFYKSTDQTPASPLALTPYYHQKNLGILCWTICLLFKSKKQIILLLYRI